MMRDELHLELKGFSVVSKFARVWELLASDGHRFDSWSVGNAHRPLGDDALSRIEAATKKTSFWRVVLQCEDPAGPTFQLHRDQISLCFDWAQRSVPAWLNWLDGFLALAPLTSGLVRHGDFETFNVYRHGPHAGWLFLCGGAERRRLEAAGVTAFLAKRKGGFERNAKQKTLVVGLAASPLDVVKGNRAALTESGDALLVAAVQKQAKVDATKLGRAIMTRVLEPRGFKEVKPDTPRELAFENGKLSVVSRLDVGEPTSELYVAARLQGSSANSYFNWSLARGSLPKARATLEKAMALFVTQAERFVKNPKRFR